MSARLKPLEFSHRAAAEFSEALAFIALASPAGADLVRQRVSRVFDLIQAHPELGTPGKLQQTRDWPVVKTSLTVTYQILEDRIRVLRIRHQSRKFP